MQGQVAQSVEQWTENPRVGSSILPLATMQSRRISITDVSDRAAVDACGALALLGYAALAFFSAHLHDAPNVTGFLALMAWGLLPLGLVFARFRRRPHEFPLVRLLCWALAFRLCGLWGVPIFEDDWFRYLWDGYRFFETGSPYGFAPMQAFADESVPAAFQRILDQINNPHLPTIYGPTTEYAFLVSHVLAPASLTPLKLLLITVDLLLIRLLLSAAPAGFVALYAWCPLVIKEIAFSAHADGLGLCLAFAALLLHRREQFMAAGICIGLAVGAKVFALLLLPFVLIRAPPSAWLGFAGTLLLLYLPFLMQGSTDLASLMVFARDWEFNAALYALLSMWIEPIIAKALLAACLLAALAFYWLRFRAQPSASLPRGDLIFGGLLLVSPVINPWYALWLLPFAVIHPTRWAWTLAAALPLAYITGQNLGGLAGMEPYAQPLWVRPIEFGLVLIALGMDWRASRRRRHS